MDCDDASSAFVVAGGGGGGSGGSMGPASATPAFSVVGPYSGLSAIPGFEASSPCSSSDYAGSYGSSVSDDGSYSSVSNNGYNLGGVDFSGALLLPPGSGSGSSAFSHRSDSSGGGGGNGSNGGLLWETWDFSPGVGVGGLSGGGGMFDGGFGGVPGGIFADGGGVIGVATTGVMTGNGLQTAPPPGSDNSVMNQHYKQPVDPWFYQQPHRSTSQVQTPVTFDTRSSSSSSSSSSSTGDNAATAPPPPPSSTGCNAAAAAAAGAKEEAPSSGHPVDDGSSSNNNFNLHSLVIDTGNNGNSSGNNGSGTACGSPLAESWTECLETPLGVGGLEAFEACHDNNDNESGAEEDKFDYLAVFAFQDHFGML